MLSRRVRTGLVGRESLCYEFSLACCGGGAFDDAHKCFVACLAER